MAILRLALHYVGLLQLLIIAGMGAALWGGSTRPDTPPFAYYHSGALQLYDPHTHQHVILSRTLITGTIRWFEDGSGIAMRIGTDGSWAVYDLNSGWHYQQGAPSRLSRDIAAPFPRGTSLLTRQTDSGTWDVSIVDDADRIETPLRPLQDLPTAPALFWSGDGDHLLALVAYPDATRLALIDVNTQRITRLASFAPGSTHGSTSYASDGEWLAFLIHPPNASSRLYLVNTLTGEVQFVRAGVTGGPALVGFRPDER